MASPGVWWQPLAGTAPVQSWCRIFQTPARWLGCAGPGAMCPWLVTAAALVAEQELFCRKRVHWSTDDMKCMGRPSQEVVSFVPHRAALVTVEPVTLQRSWALGCPSVTVPTGTLGSADSSASLPLGTFPSWRASSRVTVTTFRRDLGAPGVAHSGGLPAPLPVCPPLRAEEVATRSDV